jgi:diguanylate cyclase (GGDEF)-like protein
MIDDIVRSKLKSRVKSVAALAVVSLVAMMMMPAFSNLLSGTTSMLSVHLLMELFAVVIAMLIVTVSWHTFDARSTGSASILICGFLIVASCDVVHALTYKGMPPFLAESSTPRAIFFWLMGRSFEVATMAMVALGWELPWTRKFWLGTGLLISAVLIWFGSYHIDAFPLTFILGEGVTSFKAGYEYVLCFLNIAVALLFWARAERSGRSRYYLMALSSFVMGIGEIAFTAYVEPSDFQNIFGHIYKLLAYGLLYWANFVTSMREPFAEVHQSERRLRESENRLSHAEHVARLGNWTLDRASDELICSDGIFHLFEIDPNRSSVSIAHLLNVIHPDDLDSVRQVCRDALKNKLPCESTYRLLMKDGSVKWVHEKCVSDFDTAGNVLRTHGYVQDVTERKLAEEEIHSLAFYDALTQLPNRRLLMDRLHKALSSSARSRYCGAVLFLDMDRFKTLNDTLGHAYGDLLLIEVAQRLHSSVREVDTVARLGGDEFVVLIEEIDENAGTASQKVAQIAEKIRAALSAPYQLRGNQQHSSPSIGVTLYCGDEESADTLLKQADMAMYQAKESGRNAVCFFDPAMQQIVEQRGSIEADLHQAIAGQQLHLYYQIQIGSDLRPLGAEALVRWVHPARGMVSPAQFIPVAEGSALIISIGDWVLDTACRQLGVWAADPRTRDLTLAVNVSARQFKQPDFVDKIAALLNAHRIDASRLKLELTESVVLNDVLDVIAKMHALKALGVGLSIDDFGTGYSSLAYLKQLPVDQIKIDQSFVRNMVTDQNDAVMVKTIIDLAKNFRLNVIAEGVETETQLMFLKELGCMAYQGYFFNKPMPIEQFQVLLQAH